MIYIYISTNSNPHQYPIISSLHSNISLSDLSLYHHFMVRSLYLIVNFLVLLWYSRYCIVTFSPKQYTYVHSHGLVIPTPLFLKMHGFFRKTVGTTRSSATTWPLRSGSCRAVACVSKASPSTPPRTAGPRATARFMLLYR